jgi:phospholipase C
VSDDFGGWYDHVAPPLIDRWGPGSRVPLLLISPYAKKSFVDSTFYDTTSLLKFIETRWNLEPLAERDAKAADLTNMFDFTQEPAPARAPAPVTGEDLRISGAANSNPPEQSTDAMLRPWVLGLLIAAAVVIGVVMIVCRRKRT